MATVRQKSIAGQHRERGHSYRSSEILPIMRTVDRERALDQIAQHDKDMIHPCRKCRPLVRNDVENTDRPAEIRPRRTHQHGAIHRNRSTQKGTQTNIIDQNFRPQTALETQSANRSPEMRPQTMTVGQKRSHNPNGTRPAPRPCKTPRTSSF